MKQIIVELTDEEYKSLEWQVNSPEEWITHAAKNKARQSGERMLLELSDKRLDVMDDNEKKNLIKNSILKTRKQRDIEESENLLKEV